MIPAGFAYAAPHTADAVLSLLAEHPDEVKLLAGGQSLIPLLRFRLADPAVLVDLRHLDELRNVEDVGDGFRVGAMVSHRELLCSDAARAWPIIRDGGADLADPLVRNRGTFGGSLAHADPAGDWPPIAMSLDATLQVRSVGRGREIRSDGFFTGLFGTALAANELLTHVVVPKPPAGSRSAYVKIPHPASGYAVAGAAAVLVVQDQKVHAVRIALTGIGAVPVRARAAEDHLLGTAATEESLSAAAVLAADGVDVLGDSYAPADYRRHLATVVVRRALARAMHATGG